MSFSLNIKSFVNFKVYFFEKESQKFDLCVQGHKILSAFKVVNEKSEKTKDLVFKNNFKDFEKTESTPPLFFFIYPSNEVFNTNTSK